MIDKRIKIKIGSYEQAWENMPETYCPECGKQSVWSEDDEGDYYDGPQYICCACGAWGHKWFGEAREYERDKVIVSILRRVDK